MTERHTNTVVLKILSGVQAGVDVSLVDGTYILGSGDDADIQLFDVSLSPHHARLIVQNTRVSIQTLSGSLQMRSGVLLEAGSKAHELRPLDLVTAGTTRFAVAPLAANWALLGTAEAPARARRLFSQPPDLTLVWRQHRRALLSAVAGLFILGFWIVPHGMVYITTLGGRLAPAQEQVLSAALQSLDFPQHLTIRRSGDGSLHVDGLVNTLDERQSAVAAIKQTGIPAATHILVLETLREDLTAAIAAEASGIDFAIAGDGAIVLQGTVPDEERAAAVIQLVRDTVGDALPLRSSLRTFDDLLAEVTALARRAQISRSVQFRLDSHMIDAEGTIPLAQLDAWAGFLQSYSRRFSPSLPLRSLVRLQNPDGAADEKVPLTPFYIGADNPVDGRMINLERLGNGRYTAADLLIGGEAADARSASAQIAERPAAPVAVTPRPAKAGIDLAAVLDQGSETLPANLDSLAQRAIYLFEKGQLVGTTSAIALHEALQELEHPDGYAQTSLAIYRTLLQTGREKPQRPCWTGSAVTMNNVTGALFWLDVFSGSNGLSVTSLDLRDRTIVAEAALNPTKVARCAQLVSDGALTSRYLERVSSEPHLAGTLLRDIPPAGVRISGLSLPGNRYFQTTGNQILQEGALTNANMSVNSIGELGVLFTSGAGISVSFIGDELAWKTN